MRRFLKNIFAAAVVAAVCLVASGNVAAQFRYGPSVGVNFSTLHFSQDLISVGRVAGPNAGLQAEMMFPGIGFGLGLGVHYNMLGAKVNLGEKLVWQSQGYGNERLMLHYINIPFHLRFKWTRMEGIEDYIAPLVYFGPDFEILAGAGSASAFSTPRLSMSLSAGFGVEILRKWQLTAAYVTGMTDAARTVMLDDFHAKSRYWTIRLAYLF